MSICRCFHGGHNRRNDGAMRPDTSSAENRHDGVIWVGCDLKCVVLLGAFLFLVIPSLARADAGSQGKNKKITIGVRADAPPFSSITGEGPHTASGYTVDLCKRIAERAVDKGLYKGIEYRMVTAATRFELLQCGAIDLLCGATTVTLERSRVADFSLFTFLSGISVMYLEEAPETNGHDPGPLYVGVLGKTTSEAEARRILENLERTHDNFGLPPSRQVALRTVESHYEGFLQLKSGQIQAYLADREILLALQPKKIADVEQALKHMTAAKADKKKPADAEAGKKKRTDAEPGEKNGADTKPAKLVVSDDYYSVEPYAIGIHSGNVELRYIANSVLSELYNWDLLGNQREHIFTVLSRNFPRKRFSKTLESLFRLQRLSKGQPIPAPDKTVPCLGVPLSGAAQN